MALGDGQNGASKHFGCIGTEAQAQRNHTRCESAQREVGHADKLTKGAHGVDAAKVDQQHPEQLGNAPNQC